MGETLCQHCTPGFSWDSDWNLGLTLETGTSKANILEFALENFLQKLKCHENFKKFLPSAANKLVRMLSEIFRLSFFMTTLESGCSIQWQNKIELATVVAKNYGKCGKHFTMGWHMWQTF